MPETETVVPEASPSRSPLSNPAFRYDSTARVAVLTFYDDAGEVKSQIPPERVVELYRQNGFRKAAGIQDGGYLTPAEALRLGVEPPRPEPDTGTQAGRAEAAATETAADTGAPGGGAAEPAGAGPASAPPFGASEAGGADQSAGRVSISV